MPQLAIIADDLTGAADTGSAFAEHGLRTVIALADQAPGDCDVIVISTESREIEPDRAAQAVARVATVALGDYANHTRWVYKKVDSALRGNAREEMIALLDVLGLDRALIAPAFPAQRRTTVGGWQLIDGVPLEKSRFGSGPDSSNLVKRFYVDAIPTFRIGLEIIRAGGDGLHRLLCGSAPGIYVADAETDADLAVLARAAAGAPRLLLSGSAGFARQLAHNLPFNREASPAVSLRPRPGGVLIVAGSQDPATTRQVDQLAAAGVVVFHPAQSFFGDSFGSPLGLIAAMAERLAAGNPVALSTSGIASTGLGGGEIAGRLAEIVSTPKLRPLVGGLVLTGGDVAAKVCARLETGQYVLVGDVLPGVPSGYLAGGNLDGALVATKAGSFGNDRALVDCAAYLRALLLS